MEHHSVRNTPRARLASRAQQADGVARGCLWDANLPSGTAIGPCYPGDVANFWICTHGVILPDSPLELHNGKLYSLGELLLVGFTGQMTRRI
jgi:hypothetical protein